jgi:hypothetical protein
MGAAAVMDSEGLRQLVLDHDQIALVNEEPGAVVERDQVPVEWHPQLAGRLGDLAVPGALGMRLAVRRRV